MKSCLGEADDKVASRVDNRKASKTVSTVESREMGRYDSLMVADLPGFTMEMMRANFQIYGINLYAIYISESLVR